ncbi:MAG: glycosyltransferase family 4 protein [Bacteroidota bacterium]
MKVLFVSSGNTGKVGTLVKNQANSLIKEGVDVHCFPIKGKGIWGYLKNVSKIRKTFIKGNYDLIHAHYSFSAFAASLSGRFPIVVSLMGSDAYMSFILRLVTRFFCNYCWDATIVKTNKMRNLLNIEKAVVIPNGVNLEIFKPMPKTFARKKIGFDLNKKFILFIADPNRKEKNFELAKKSFNILKKKLKNVELVVVNNVSNYMIPYYMNASDVLILTSLWEGSVNVVKEAMACNLPIVSTDVGDVKENLKSLVNSYTCPHNPEIIADKLFEVLNSTIKSNGRNVLIKKGLDSQSVAKNIISIYDEVIKKYTRRNNS